MQRRDFLATVALGLVGCRAGDTLMPRAATNTRLATGPWRGVFDTNDPFDANPADRLADLLNGYIPDPKNGSGAYARNGFQRAFLDAALHSAGDRGQNVYRHTMLDGTVLNFLIVGGRLLRVTNVGSFAMTVTDVTPVGITIRSDQYKVHVTSMVSNESGTAESVLIVNDAQNTPWIASDLTSSPVTGTQIDYDGLGTAWVSYGAPVVWQGAVFFPGINIGGVVRGDDISWSEPGLPNTGYQQSSSDNNLTLVQHSQGALQALVATNSALYYFRAQSIGVIYGGIGTLVSSNTIDAVSVNVGTLGSLTIQQFGDAIFFCDRRGRPHRFIPGRDPEPIWRQMRGRTDTWTSANFADGGVLQNEATSAIDPTRNLYLVRANETNMLYAFDADSGTYMGRWTIFDDGSNGGIAIDAIGVLHNGLGIPTLFVIGETSPGGDKGYGWTQLVNGWAFENNEWMDGRLDGQKPNIQVTTDRLGEHEELVYAVDRATIITGNAAACQVTIATPNGSAQLEGAPSPGASSDGTFRLVVGCDGVQGRGPAVTVAPQFTDADQATLDQWSLHRVSLAVAPSLAGPEDDL